MLSAEEYQAWQAKQTAAQPPPAAAEQPDINEEQAAEWSQHLTKAGLAEGIYPKTHLQADVHKYSLALLNNDIEPDLIFDLDKETLQSVGRLFEEPAQV